MLFFAYVLFSVSIDSVSASEREDREDLPAVAGRLQAPEAEVSSFAETTKKDPVALRQELEKEVHLLDGLLSTRDRLRDDRVALETRNPELDEMSPGDVIDAPPVMSGRYYWSILMKKTSIKRG